MTPGMSNKKPAGAGLFCLILLKIFVVELADVGRK